jgi:SAM-dependent methyltransferase
MEINKYEKIAKFYEQCGPDFWLPFKKMFENNIDKSKKYNLIDLGCGTGDAIKYLGEYVERYRGVDHSTDMLEISKRKYPEFDFIQGDITDYRNKDGLTYDIAISAFDTINHLLSKSSWQNFFNSAHNLLNDEGFLIFDMCTVNDHKNNWINYVDLIENHDYSWIRKGEYDLESSIASMHNYFFISTGSDNSYIKEYDIIKQISFEVDEVNQMLSYNKFSIIESFDLHTGKQVDERTSVATFIAKK